MEFESESESASVNVNKPLLVEQNESFVKNYERMYA